MKYAKLGNSELNVSRICMGCMGFGDAANGQHSWTIDEAHAREIIRRGLELGVNFFDTAIAYQSGTSEQYLGRALRDFARRDEVVVATKFLPRTPEEIAAGVSGQQHIARMIDKSLENLGMDHVIDIRIAHVGLSDAAARHHGGPQRRRPRRQGALHRHFQLLCLAAGKGERARGARGLGEVCLRAGALQPHLPRGGARMVPCCRAENIALTPYSALAGGRLSKHPGETSKRLEQDAYARLKYDAAAEQDGEIIRRVAELADARGVTMTEISLAWLLTKVTAPVVGATKLHHIEGAARAVDLALSAEEIAYLEAPYAPHRLVGVMAQNTASASGETHVWSTGNQKI